MSAGWRHSNGYLLTVLTLVSTMNWADRQVVPILFPGIRAELGLSDTELGIVGGLAFSLIYAISGFAFGLAADRMIRVRVIAFGLVVWSAATAAGALAVDFWTLFAARFFTGIGEASLFPCALSLVGERFPPERRGRALGLFGVAAAIGGGLGVGLGGWLAERLGWREVFLLYGGVGLLLLPLVLSVPERARPRPVQHAGPAPRIVREILADRALLLMWLGGMMAIGSALGFAAWAPSYFVRNRGFEVGEAGIFFGGGALLGGIIGSLVGGRLADWRRNARPAGELDVSAAAALISAPLVLLSINTALPWLFVAAGLGTFIVIYMCFPALNAFMVARVPDERRGLATAINVFFLGGLGSAAGPFVVGLASDATGSLHTALWTPAIGLLIAVLLIRAAGRAARASARAGAAPASVTHPPDAA